MNAPDLALHLIVPDAAEASAFYQAAFGAEELFRLVEPSGKLGHVELRLGGAILMLAEAYPELGLKGPRDLGGAAHSLSLAVADVGLALTRAEAAGAKVVAPPKLQFYGDEVARIEDPAGHRWSLRRTVEALSPEAMQARFAALFA